MSAAVVNVTATEAAGPGDPGYVQADAIDGFERRTNSNVNASAAGQTVPNAAVVPIGRLDFPYALPGMFPPITSAPAITLFSQAGSHLLADLFGFFT